MINFLRLTSTISALAFTAFIGGSLAAQQPQPTPTPNPNPTADPRPAPQLRTEQPDRPKAEASLKGELVKVDTTAKMLSIKTDDGKTEMVSYNDDTKVTGAQTGIAGLANQSNTKVTVKFTGTGITRVASEIVVEKDRP
jgi:hypothetical protein